MSFEIEIGDEVRWSWGDGEGAGTVIERYTEKVTKDIKGNEVTRDASEEEPAYLIEQEDGDLVLKSSSELEASGGSG